MKTIYKYTLGETICLPVGARILDIQPQHGMLQLWALVDPEAALEQFEVVGAPTGGSLPLDIDGCRYIRTIQDGAGLVGHVFLRALGLVKTDEAPASLNTNLN